MPNAPVRAPAAGNAQSSPRPHRPPNPPIVSGARPRHHCFTASPSENRKATLPARLLGVARKATGFLVRSHNILTYSEPVAASLHVPSFDAGSAFSADAPDGDDMARSLATRLSAESASLAREMVRRLHTNVPFYAHLPDEQLDGDILTICQHNIDVFLQLLGTGRPPSPEALEVIQSSAARRAEERVPLDAVLSAYHVGLMMMWGHVQREAATMGRPEHLPEVATVAMSYIEQVTSLVSGAYVEEHALIYGAERDIRRALVAALLTGEPAGDLAMQAGTRLHDDYLVVAARMGHSLDEGRPEVESAVAARRKIHRVSARLEAQTGTETLTLLDVSGGMILVPVDADIAEQTVDEIPDLVDDLADAAGSSIVAGYAWHPGSAGVVTSGTEARALVELALQLGRPPGAYRLADLVLEYALSRDRSAMAVLATVLNPLGGPGTVLYDTLAAYLETDLDRRRTAARLHVHPNTLDYRLRRIHALTGMHTGSASGITMLTSALVASKLGGTGP